MEIVGEQSGTVDSIRGGSRGNEAPVKKTKIMLTEERKRNLLNSSSMMCPKWTNHGKLTPSSHSRKGRITMGRTRSDLSDWWKTNGATLPGFTYVLRAVLTNSPNSCPPESLFSIFNATYDDDQKRSHTDYIQLSIQSQFN